MTLPRPTLADIDLPPRRRLRDGSRSTASASGSSSRSSSVASRGGRGRGRSVSTFSTLSSNGSEVMPTRTRTTRSRGAGAGVGGTRRSSRGRRTPSPPHDDPDPVWDPPPLRTYDQGATLLDMLDVIDGTNHRHHHHQPVDTVASTSSSSSSTSTSSPNRDQRQQPHAGGGGAGRRYTAAEKGKGRAPPAETITISDNEDEGIVVTGIKRKVHEVDEEEMGDEVVEHSVNVESEAEAEAEAVAEVQAESVSDRLGEFTCPVCFSEPTQAVMTVCGHVLCAECLHSSLLAAIARNPNPHPHNQPPPPRPKPKPRSKSRQTKKTKIEPQPTAWTIHTLREAWLHQRDVEYTKNAKAAGMDEASIEAGREPEDQDPGHLSVMMVLKGLWKVEDRYWIIEGECPVCRKGLPGGYGPPFMGIGGVIPLKVRIGGGK